MKIAITTWEDRVSPVFDSSHLLLVAEILDGAVIEKRFEGFDPKTLRSLVVRLKSLGIDVLICGAVTLKQESMIKASGIHLIPFVGGMAERILDDFSKGAAITPRYLMPGCRKKVNPDTNSWRLGQSKKKTRRQKNARAK